MTDTPTRQQRRAEERRTNKQGIVHVETLTRAEALARGKPVCSCCPDAGVTVRTETYVVDAEPEDMTREELIAALREADREIAEIKVERKVLRDRDHHDGQG